MNPPPVARCERGKRAQRKISKGALVLLWAFSCGWTTPSCTFKTRLALGTVGTVMGAVGTGAGAYHLATNEPSCSGGVCASPNKDHALGYAFTAAAAVLLVAGLVTLLYDGLR
jgi:hypothetical protein